MKRTTLTLVLSLSREITPAEQAELEQAMIVQAEDFGYHYEDSMKFHVTEESDEFEKINAQIDSLMEDLQDLAMIREIAKEERGSVADYENFRRVDDAIEYLESMKRNLKKIGA